jgi:hypothetical protein
MRVQVHVPVEAQQQGQKKHTKGGKLDSLRPIGETVKPRKKE